MATGETDGPEIGVRIQALREARGWSQRQLAVFAGVSHGYINLLEAGKVPRPSVSKLRLIADALQVRMSEINGEDAEQTSAAALIRDLASHYVGGNPYELMLWFDIYEHADPEKRKQLLDIYKAMTSLGEKQEVPVPPEVEDRPKKRARG